MKSLPEMWVYESLPEKLLRFIPPAIACFVLIGCGEGAGVRSVDHPPTEMSAGLTTSTLSPGKPLSDQTKPMSGCGPEQVANRLVGLFDAVQSRDREAAFTSIASGRGLVGFTVFDATKSGNIRFDLSDKAAIYDRLTKLIGTDVDPRLLAAEVSSGAPGPLESEREGPEAEDRTGGIEFSVALGNETAEGKGGIDCENGRFYAVGMNFGPGLVKQQVCGEYVHLRSRRPLICAVGEHG
jgi:hypothetical protein